MRTGSARLRPMRRWRLVARSRSCPGGCHLTRSRSAHLDVRAFGEGGRYFLAFDVGDRKRRRPIGHLSHLHVVEGFCPHDRELFILLRTGCTADTDRPHNLALPFERNAALPRREVLKIAAKSNHRDGGASTVGRSRRNTPWQPLRRIVSRQTVQRMDICRRKVNALTELGEKWKGKKGIENW